MDFTLAQIWSLLRSQLTPKMSCIGNWIKNTLQRAARSNHFLVLFCYVLIFWIFWNHFLVLFCYVLIFWIFWIFWISFSHGWNSRMDFPLAQICSLSRSQLTPKMSCIGNWIKKLWLRSAILYFAQRIFIWRMEFQNGFSFCMDVELIK